MSPRILHKPPRTLHLPWSEGRTADDLALTSVPWMRGRRVVVTEKLDGENTTIYGPDGYVHARSTDPLAPHPSRDRMKALAAELGPELPDGWRITGENVTAVHSIHYHHLPAHPRWFFRPFNVWNDRNECLPWGEVLEWCDLLDLLPVPVLYDGPFSVPMLRQLETAATPDEREGYVVRWHDGFPFASYEHAVAKYVRPGHNRCADDWQRRVVLNETECSPTSSRS